MEVKAGNYMHVDRLFRLEMLPHAVTLYSRSFTLPFYVIDMQGIFHGHYLISKSVGMCCSPWRELIVDIRRNSKNIGQIIQ